jgi:hypothetical protein
MFADSTKIRSALRLEIVTMVWMLIEASVAVGAGIVAQSAAYCLRNRQRD